MLARYTLIAAASVALLPALAERIYILPGTGYNQCDPQLVTAIQSQGHTVDLSPNNTIPVGFTTTCVDPVNGYDWLCFFGNDSRVALLPDVQAFIDLGGKLFLQWEVSCCTFSSASSAALANALTGQPIAEDLNSSIAGGSMPNVPGWEAQTVEGCLNVEGNAYKCMDGVPTANQLVATGTLNGATPAHTACPVFGFVFGPNDLPNGSGGIVGFGDVNMWYTSAGEPPNSGGSQPVDMNVVELLFPTPTSGCSLLPPGCLSGSTVVPDADAPIVRDVYPNPANEVLYVDLLRGSVKEIRIFNAQGQLVHFERPAGSNRMMIPTGSLTEGLYHMVLNGSTTRQEKSFVIAR